jgi:hypothetical protein
MKYNYMTTDVHDVDRIVIKKEQELLNTECHITKIVFFTDNGEYEVTAYGTKEGVKIEGREV